MQAIEINLLQQRQKEVQPGRTVPILLVAVAIIAVVSLAWTYINTVSEIKSVKAEIELAEQSIQVLETKVHELQQLQTSHRLVELIDVIRGSYMKPTEVLKALTPHLPVDANLTSIILSGDQVKVTGLFASTEEVVSFMQELKNSEVFTFIRSGGMTKVEHPMGEDYLPAIQVTFDIGLHMNSEE
ncbi:hypothetical protein PRECH8_16530 [Insulibacter thermoxylanivorax]|uniref:Type IV pilus assembly protein PilN n=1 Tax=Insulibacter thermoxylanivorax TaxID=2749268 RepID=A0A916QCT0_9BACL|nr:PilN domain-containing protein [Insulibacter thermoxylanivorax]GFR38357.1 hypothetical protein PRECH8_16530 [Insulibacter thermoxylanivorax]